MGRPLTHPRMETAFRDHWPSLCTIQWKVTAASESNEELPTVYDPASVQVTGPQDMEDHVDIPCRVSPVVEVSPRYEEKRTPEAISAFKQAKCKLDGYFPLIEVRLQQAVIGGETWEIRGVEHDSQHFSTRLMLEIVTL